MAAIAGLRGTGDWATDERPKNFLEMILWLNPNGDTPINGFLAKSSTKATDDPEFSWFEETLDILQLQLNDATGMLAADTAVVVDSGALNLVPGDILLVEKAGTNQTATYDNELVRVTSVTNDTSFAISRGEAGTTAAPIADNDYLLNVGSVSEEGTASPASTTRNPTKVSNFTQIFKTTYSITGTAASTRTRTGDPIANDKKRKIFDHSRKLEYSWIFGQPFENLTGAVNGKPERFTGGFLHFLSSLATSRIVVKSANYTAGNIDVFFDDVFDVFDFTNPNGGTSDQRLAVVGNGALNAINKLAAHAGQVEFGDVVTQYGMELTRLRMPQGNIFLRSHPLLNRHKTVYTNTMIIIDPKGLQYRPLKGRDTRFKDNIQANDEDSVKGQWMTEAGLEFHHLETMKCITNIGWSAV